MDINTSTNVKLIWDYMCLNSKPEKADCIVGFGSYNEDVATRAAELYKQQFAPKILFSGGLGRNTEEMWTTAEADRFAKIAINEGVPKQDIIIENKSTNTGENILFTKNMFENLNMNVKKILVVHKPFMGRRIYAALKMQWPEINAVITSPQAAMQQYIEMSVLQGVSEKTVIDVIVGDLQRMEIYANKGYQIKQHVPKEVKNAYETLVELGYTSQLVK